MIMKELHLMLSRNGGLIFGDSYQCPSVTVFNISSEGVLCQSSGSLSAGHDGFDLDEGNPGENW